MQDFPVSDEDDDFSKESEVKRPRLLTAQERDRLEVQQYLSRQQRKSRSEAEQAQNTQSLQLALARQQAELAALREELTAAAAAATAAKAELGAVQQQVAALRCIVDDSKHCALNEVVKQDVCSSYTFPGQPLLYREVPEFSSLRQAAVYNRIELLATVSVPVAGDRLCELRGRKLLDADIESCLKIKKESMEERAASPRRVQDAVFQLFKLLHRRQTAVLQGYKLAPQGSLFADVPK